MVDEIKNPRYFHRDLSWLLFNRRVILEAYDADHPLLEQLRFLAIASNNLDEFYMVRVPQVQSLVRLSSQKIDGKTGLKPKEVLQEVFRRNQENLAIQYRRYRELLLELQKKHCYLKHFSQLTVREKRQVGRYFDDVILPTLNPIGVDAYHAFPRLLEKALHLGVQLKNDEECKRAIVPISVQLPRLFKLSERRFILIEEIIDYYLEKVFVGYEVTDSCVFRVTYDHDLEFQEDDQEDLAEQMEAYLAERKKGLPSRIEIGKTARTVTTEFHKVTELFGLTREDGYFFNEPLDLTFLFDLADQLAPFLANGLFTKFQPLMEPKWQSPRILQTLEQEDILVQHPYDSFEVVIALLQAAVNDPRTVAVKQTLYRVAKNSQIIRLLKKAAEKGIQVTVLVEIKARFDEEKNLHWVEELEKAGCFVSYGFPNMKTHSKALLIVQKDGDEIKRYAQIGTGNYNENNSQIYTDLSFFTSREEYVNDLSDFFNYLSGYRKRPVYEKIVTSPEDIRGLILRKIDETVAGHKLTNAGEIFLKMNALTDQPIIDKLYEASQAGVKIFLQVRGACCLVPGVKNLSENITVASIVGRFLEHSRIYSFTTSRGVEWWLSSADLMTRNMVRRVEIAAPLRETSVEGDIQHIIEVYRNDQSKAYYLTSDESYQRLPGGGNGVSAQNVFLTECLRKTTNLIARRQLLIDQIRKLPD